MLVMAVEARQVEQLSILSRFWLDSVSWGGADQSRRESSVPLSVADADADARAKQPELHPRLDNRIWHPRAILL